MLNFVYEVVWSICVLGECLIADLKSIALFAASLVPIVHMLLRQVKDTLGYIKRGNALLSNWNMALLGGSGH